ncbi:MAG: PEGA domain-containing protein [Pseudothermotoga sp.]|nr:PEGA domain-containing protein [Pseudothermotoga sp.]
MQKFLIPLLLGAQICLAITIVTNVPNVEVRLGSILLAVTDRNGVAEIDVSLPATLTFVKPGYISKSILLQDSEKSHFINLIAASNLQIFTEPSGATVWIDGKQVGSTPIDLQLEPKDYEIVLQKEGFCRVKRSVALQPHEKKKLQIVLAKTPTVHINSNPPSRVWANGSYLGETPLSVELPAGEYSFKLEANDFFTSVEKVQISLDEEQYLEFSLTPSARLLVQASPPHAIVSLDGESKRQPASFDNLSLGEKIITVKAAGYEEKIMKVELKQGMNYVYVPLEPKLNRLNVIAPAEAMIFVDGKSVGRGPTSVKLSQGVHLVEARLGEKRWMGLIDLSKDEKIDVDFNVATILLLGDRKTIYTVEGVTQRPPALIYLPEGFHTIRIGERERTIEFLAGKLYTFSPEGIAYLCIFSDAVVECQVDNEFVGLSPVLFYPVKPGVRKVGTVGWERETMAEPSKVVYIRIGGD